MLFDHLEKYKNNVLFYEDNTKIFYDQIFSFEKKFKNLKKNKLILFICENSSAFLMTYISLIRKNLVIMLVDQNSDNEEIKELILSYKPSYIFMKKKTKINLDNYEINLELKNNIILQNKNNENYKIFKELALLLSTSGTTGSKKFVRISKKNLYSNTKNISNFLNIQSKDITITTLPPHYTYGLSILNSHIFSGAAVCINNLSFIDKSFWIKANKFKVNNFGGVPFNYEILKKLKFTINNLPTLKYITQAGGHLEADIKKYFLKDAKKNNYKFIVMYGQVEATSRISYLPFEKLEEKFESAGKSIPEGNLSISLEDHEIIYNGPNVCLGYAYSWKDLTKGDENKGELKTGDIGSIDSEGYLFISGRKNRETKLFGHRINLDEIEKILKDKGYKCLCVSKKNKLFIFNLSDRNNNDIAIYLSKKIKVNINFFSIKTLKVPPINSSGKVAYTHLENLI
jgi:long-chain acyl-CoA synthetase